MLEPIWEPVPPRTPDALLHALAELPPLLVHLAAIRVQTERPNQPVDAAGIRAYLDGPPSDDFPAGRIPRLADMAERLVRAVRQGEKVGIHGDYDVDGVTSTALLTIWLRSLGADVEPFLPHREKNGYGLTLGALEALRDAGCRLVLAVDCGITAVAEAEQAHAMGIELLVLDHHTPPEPLPALDLLVDPKLPGGDPDDHCLAAVGLAYRLAEAMAARGMGETEQLHALLDLVALGTVADVATLTGQNRWLVNRGLERMRQKPRLGVAALIQRSGIRLERLSAEDVAYRLAPRLNAAGRMDDPRPAFELLLARDAISAGDLAARLDHFNRERQTRTEQALQEAVEQLSPIENGEPRLLVVHGEAWHAGIVGLVAGKLTERYCRPAIALTRVGDHLRGSARSIDGFNVTLALRDCAHLLIRFGGHSHAAGLSLEAANLTALRDRLQLLADEQIAPEQMRPHLYPDALVRFTTLTRDLLRSLERLGPFGAGNPAPLLQANGVLVESAGPLGANGTHSQLRLRDNGAVMRAVCFGVGPDEMPEKGSRVDVLFETQLSEFNGTERVELRLVAHRPAGQPAGKATCHDAESLES